ncbi:glycosyltransferase family 2 protein [uncultured Subdoligranulum sp.]|uniref:glycosyltransferase family 2 protein n=1 Tax=uncultured Subdoligranulum sp. TaxID=512298 RepID=UPI0026024A6C|nr:glycosyltransferase family 2 protein [uncultured Subdoligranulum sp.]
MPAISVIIPVYKVEPYLDACVASVTAQTFSDLEILLVDDGSPDGCPALCDAWAQKDPRVRVIHRENGGLSAARNTGIDAATGQFLAFVDSDDLLEPDTLRRAYEAQRQHDADLVIFNLVYVDEHNTPLPAPDFTGFRDEVLDADGVWQRYFALAEQKIYYVVAWNKLYKRELFADLRYAEGKRYEDQFLLPGLLARCKTIACLGYPGYRYVQRGGSIMAQGSSRNYLDRSEFLLEWCAYFAGKGDVLRAEGLLNDAIRNLGEKERFDLSTKGQQVRYRTACRGCADAYRMLARRTGQRSMVLRAFLLRLGLPVYLRFLQSRQ